MARFNTSGFTVIEVTLFLAVSGLLGIGVLASASAALNNQRYQDSVRTLYTQMQAEYSNALNIQNDRSGSQLRCNLNGSVVDTSVSGGVAQSRGTSDCTIAGRLVEVSGNPSRTVTTQPVFATVDPMRDAVLPTSDEDALRRSRLVLAPTTASGTTARGQYDLEWQTSIVAPNGSPLQFRLLIVRSPYSGMMRTYVQQGTTLVPQVANSTTLYSMIGGQSEVTACVNPEGLFTGQELGVRILRNASGASSVKLLTGGVC